MKFVNLLKKELAELVNTQMILSLVVTLVVFMMLGNFMKTTIDDAVEKTSNYTIRISDREDTEFTQDMLEAIKSFAIDDIRAALLLFCKKPFGKSRLRPVVAVRKDDKITGCFLESPVPRAADASVLLMDHLNTAVFRCKAVTQRPCPVG